MLMHNLQCFTFRGKLSNREQCEIKNTVMYPTSTLFSQSNGNLH